MKSKNIFVLAVFGCLREMFSFVSCNFRKKSQARGCGVYFKFRVESELALANSDKNNLNSHRKSGMVDNFCCN